ncbi:MAG: helix-turn-helix transcriptional regulator [Pseudomonadota bacterium]
MTELSFPTIVVVLALEAALLAVLLLMLKRSQETWFLGAFSLSVAAYVGFGYGLDPSGGTAHLRLAPVVANETLPGCLLLGFVSAALFGRLTTLAKSAFCLPAAEVLGEWLALATGRSLGDAFVALGQASIFLFSAYTLFLLMFHRRAYLGETAENKIQSAYVYITPAISVFVLNLLFVLNSTLPFLGTQGQTRALFIATLLIAVLWPLAYLVTKHASFLRVEPPQRQQPIEPIPAGGESSQSTDRGSATWQRLLSTLEDDRLFLEPDLTLTSLARSVGTNRAALSKLINDRAEVNFNRFINRYRVSFAQELLQQTDRSVLDIALEAGFSSKATFNRVFRSQTGQTPTDFRRDTIAGDHTVDHPRTAISEEA